MKETFIICSRGLKKICSKQLNGRNMRPCILRGNFATQMMLIVTSLLVQLPHTIVKKRSINCTIYNDPQPIFHEFYKPGDLVIGEIVTHILLFDDPLTFMKQPTLKLTNDLL